MPLPLPEWFVATRIPSAGYIRPVYERVLDQVFTTDRGTYTADSETGETLVSLEINDEDRELVPLLVREDAEEVWLVFGNEESS